MIQIHIAASLALLASVINLSQIVLNNFHILTQLIQYSEKPIEDTVAT